jgi:hypothetical protein
MTSTLPKRPVSDYIHYCAVARDQIKTANPDLKTKDIVIQMGAGWKQLSPEEKEKYSALARLDKERYTKEMEAWTANNPGVVIEKKVKVKKAKKADEPAPVAEPVGAAAEEEIVITEEELVQPVVAEKPKKTRKGKAVAAPEPTVAPVVVAEPEPVAAPVEKEKKPPSRYQNFLKAQRPLLKEAKPDLKPKEVLTELGAMWSKLSVKEQEQY